MTLPAPANDNAPQFQTSFLLMAQYGGAAVIPVEAICRDYFSHLSPAKFVRKANAGELGFAVTRMDASQKSAKGVHLMDFAAYLDERRAIGQSEFKRMAA